MLTGKEIKLLREFLEMTPTEFAARLGVSGSAVSRWEDESGKGRHPRWETMEKINQLAAEAKSKGFKLPARKQEVSAK